MRHRRGPCTCSSSGVYRVCCHRGICTYDRSYYRTCIPSGWSGSLYIVHRRRLWYRAYFIWVAARVWPGLSSHARITEGGGSFHSTHRRGLQQYRAHFIWVTAHVCMMGVVVAGIHGRRGHCTCVCIIGGYDIALMYFVGVTSTRMIGVIVARSITGGTYASPSAAIALMYFIGVTAHVWSGLSSHVCTTLGGRVARTIGPSRVSKGKERERNGVPEAIREMYARVIGVVVARIYERGVSHVSSRPLRVRTYVRVSRLSRVISYRGRKVGVIARIVAGVARKHHRGHCT